MAQVVLFQGDSVTDAGRTGGMGDLGAGYPKLAAELLRQDGSPDTVINRGVSGDRTCNLVARWDADTLALKPDVLTILIGINDCWRKYDSNDETPIAQIEANYRNILDRTKAALPACRIILMEAFVLPWPEDRREWRVTLDPILHQTRLLAREYGARLVPLDGILNAAAVELGYETVCPDGVHPSDTGHAIIAREWQKVYRSL